MVYILVDQPLTNITVYKLNCLQIINKLYKPADKWDDENNYKVSVEVYMISIPEGPTNNSPMEVPKSGFNKNHSSRKPLSKFSEIFEAKQKLISADQVLLRQRTRLSEKVIHCDQLFKSGKSIPKSMHL